MAPLVNDALIKALFAVGYFCNGTTYAVPSVSLDLFDVCILSLVCGLLWIFAEILGAAGVPFLNDIDSLLGC